MKINYFKELETFYSKVEAYDSKGRLIALDKAISNIISLINSFNKKTNKVIFIGNGGSASIASHLSTDFLKNAEIPVLKAKGFYARNKDFLIILAVALVYYTQHLLSVHLGMHSEESRDANAYLLALQGYLPYRDFTWPYGPFAFLIYPLIMKVWGVNLMVLRISYIIFVSFVIPLSYFLAKRLMPSFWAGIAAFLSIVLFDVPYYTFNHIFATIGILVSLLLVCRFIETNQKALYLFWAGIFSSVTWLTKPLLPGVTLFVTVSLFLIGSSGNLRRKTKDYFLFIVGIVVPIIIYLFCFFPRTILKNSTVMHHSFFGKGSIVFNILARGLNLESLWLFFRFPVNLFINNIKDISSFAGFKKLLASSFEVFISFLPYIVFVLILFIYVISKAKAARAKPALKEKIVRDRKFLFLFAVFSLFIALEGIVTHDIFGRAYTIQVTFILTVYILYLLKTFFFPRSILTKIFIFLFLFYLGFLHFFRYPYAHSKKYTVPLNLERAKGIYVTTYEKELYESLSSYLSANLNKEDKIAVMGYFPQFGFLTEKDNVFQDDEYVFTMLYEPSTASLKREALKQMIVSLEDRIISKIEKEKPRIALVITGDASIELASLSWRINACIERNYSLVKIFGPADLFVNGWPKVKGGYPGWVKLYKFK